MAFAGLTEARARVAKLAEALSRAAGGEVLTSAAAKVQAQIDAVSRDKVAKHKASGHAAGALAVRASGDLVTLSVPTYLNFHAWWPFRRGMPPFVLKRAAQILAAELLAVLGDDDAAGRMLAQDVAKEAEIADAAAAAKAEEKQAAHAARQFKRETARIWRQSEAGKAARRAAAKQRRAQKAATS